MTVNNKIAKAIGALFIVTMLLGMIDAYTVAPLLNQPLEQISSHENRVFVGAFSVLLMSIGVVGIAVLFYPILETTNKSIAITYVCSRVMECLLLLTGVIIYFLLISLSQKYIGEGYPKNSYYQTLSQIAIEARYGAYHVAMIILSIASMMLCALMYKSRLIPRLISIVGFVGYTMVLLSAPLDILDIIDTTSTGGILYVPGAIFEILLLPIWLFAKGFKLSDSIST